MATSKFPVEDANANGSNGRSAGSSQFAGMFGEDVERLLDLSSWTPGAGLLDTYARMEREVSQALERERRHASEIRRRLFPRIREAALAGDVSGVYRATTGQVVEILNGLLLSGNVEACEGYGVAHSTLALTFMQMGVCMVSYDGDQQSWSQRMYRRDYRAGDGDPLGEMLQFLERRRSDPAADRISSLARRGLLAYAQRKFLVSHSDARWKMCQGTPAPFELITGAGILSPTESGMVYPLMEAGMAVLRELILDHRRFVFVPRTNRDKDMLTIGATLAPLEYAVIDTISDQIEAIERGNYDDRQRAVIADFRRDVGDVVVRGVFRASAVAPPQMFHAHRDHAHVAALIAIADSALQENRGYPVLLDLADAVCRVNFGADSFAPQIGVAYTDAGAPWMAHRMTAYD